MNTGTVAFGGVNVTRAEPRLRDVGMVFQDPVLFANRSVRRNVAFPLEIRRQTLESIRNRVDAETRAMHIEHLLTRNPEHLSRGEQQLVQIARTMVRAPRVLLLDEPFAPLDEHLRRRMRAELAMLQQGYGVTTIMSSNDPDDVAAVATHLVVLGPLDGTADERGTGAHTVVQSGTPAAVADDPVSMDVATTVGPLWTLDVDVVADGGGFWLIPTDRAGSSRIRAWRPGLAEALGRPVVVGFRPGDLRLHPQGEIEARLERLVPGAVEPLLCRVGGRVVYASTGDASASDLAPGDAIRLQPSRTMVFDPVTGSRLT